MRTIQTARIWVFLTNGPVKISVPLGKTLTHRRFERTDEGWDSETNSWTWDGTRLVQVSVSEGRDCDGRLTRGWRGFTTPDKFKARVEPLLEGYLWPGIRPPAPEIVWPDWKTEDEGQHLQIAFGRGVFRLLHVKGPGDLTPGLIYLRDLPLNLATLAAYGYPHALAAYHAECQRAGIEAIHELHPRA